MAMIDMYSCKVVTTGKHSFKVTIINLFITMETQATKLLLTK